MKKVLVFLFTVLASLNLMAKTLHVDLNSTNPTAPYASRDTAATSIQTAVNAAVVGDTVLVWDGYYLLASQISVSKAITIQSVNGPESTIVDGQGSVPCFSLGNTACVIEGLTITNGYSSGWGGGIYCSGIVPVVTNCTISGNTAEYGGGMRSGTANNCTISGNTAYSGSGGGMYSGTANNCSISGNTATDEGGGMYYGTANNCSISGNTATDEGGGMYSGTANNCSISGNTAQYGGGMSSGTANNCTISGNSAVNSGGGMYRGTANNCTISGNTAKSGGGMSSGTANNCTITGNSAVNSGGGMSSGTANNCIVWYNTAPSGKDLFDTTARYSCSPDVTHGVDGNITNAPVLVSSSHIAADSPCRGAGSADYATGTDIDGEAWANPPSMGCDEPANLPGGPMEVAFVASESMVVTGYPIQFKGQIHGALSQHIWDFGDGTQVTNSPFVEHAWVAAGTYDVVLTAYNADWPDGVSATQEVVIVDAEETAIYVSIDGDDANDGTSWASAKKTIQAGVDVQIYAGGFVRLRNGTYSLSATITVNKLIRIVGVDGPESTIVDGNGSVRCLSLGNTACVIEGLTITNGYYSGGGGGIYCSDTTPVVTNCIISGNKATQYGGGMYYGTANNCTFSGNSATYGGGMYYGTANNCTFSGNSATNGGGMNYGTANNCTFSGNSASQGGGMYSGTANHCTISGNSAKYGGGMYYGTANNCILSGNTASTGGGMYRGTANNCILSGNTAQSGGGMSSGTANNCTITGNSASGSRGGMSGGTANNCIVWYNTAPTEKDLVATTASYSCSPDVTHGVNGNITNAPMLVSSSHIAADSPCRGAGSAEYTTGTDIDGEPWTNPPSMGCDELADLPVGPIQVAFVANELMVASGYPVRFQEQIHGALSAHIWDFGDGTRVTNSLSVEHVWAASGTFDVVLTAYNADWPDGVSATQEVSIVSFEETAIHVSSNGNDANDGTSWANAKETIQAGVDAQMNLGGLVLVGSGTYSLSATITVSKPVHIMGVDGPESTIVDGQGSVRCFSLGNTAWVIEGLTITNGYTANNGGGIYCSGIVPVVTNCIISGNTAEYGGGMRSGTANNCTISGNTAYSGSGGGMYSGTANNCSISGNTATDEGGGMYYGTANNCSISGNTAQYGGGMSSGTANNCTFSGNTAATDGGGMYQGTANNCILSGNTASQGGGMYSGTANHCTISGNSAKYGGGMYYGTANNCTIRGNSASQYGGGMSSGTANNCTITGNSATSGGGMSSGTANNCTITGNSATSGGGMYSGTANNCIIWYNTAPTEKDLVATTASYSCSPDVTHGVNGNITNAPMLVSSSHIAADSPCRGAGSADYATGTDIDGEAWANPPSMGCDEPTDLPVGPIQVDFVANESMVASGYLIRFRDQIHGAISGHIWDFGDGTRVTNSPSVEHVWTASGTFDVVLTAYNADWPGGVSATQKVSIVSLQKSTIYVSPDGNNANDGTSWASAKATIQAGVDAQGLPGGWVYVGNGTYFLSATITISKPVHIMGVDGPESTIVDGQGSVRCFSLGNTAWVIEGLTITNGYTANNGGGIYCSGIVPVVTNCIISGNKATQHGGGMVGGTANHCTISGNTAYSGGGMYSGTANNCTFSGNSADYGGGMYQGTANNCILSGNTASDNGGGMSSGTANNCILSGNTASDNGGGMSSGTANNCTFSGNSAYHGGGMRNGTANNCTITGNSATSGGGICDGTANNCTLSGNTAEDSGGGMSGGTANNCIVWYNTAPTGKDLVGTTASYSCSPDVTHGVDGNITNAPMLLSSSHIAADSPCRGAGSAEYTTGTDIDGESWANPPSMGCDELADLPVGPIQVAFVVSESMVASGYPVRFQEQIHGAISEYVWDFGDGTRVTNSLSVEEHAWATAGTFDVVLTGYNADWPDGVSATQKVSVVSFEETAIHVSSNGNDANDGTSWASAKKTIQAGIDAQIYAGGGVLVGSGTYSLTETITVSKPVRIVGVDGAGSTIVDGQGNVGCFNLSNIACVIEEVTITNGKGYDEGGVGRTYGGGIYCSGIVPVVTRCTISGNRAGDSGGGMFNGTANHCTISGNRAGDSGGGMSGGTANHCTISGNSATYGGGMSGGTANNCILSGNSVRYDGGGMYGGTANNCTITGNSATQYGGGMRNCTANNCIAWYNTAPSGRKDLSSTLASYSCSPDVTDDMDGNITNAPIFVDSVNGDYRLAAGSRCIDAGSNGYVVGSLDLAGMPRIVNGIVDMGAYEYQGTGIVDQDSDGLPDGWETEHFGGTAGQGAEDDYDNDQLDNISEWIAGTDPSDPNSVFAASISTNQVPTGFVIEWTSVEDRTYSVRWGRTLTNAYGVLEEGIEYPQNSYTDTVHNAESTGFYQIEVQLK